MGCCAWGLTRTLEKFPQEILEASAGSANAAVLAFNQRIIDATCDITAAYKPQAAFYAALAAEEALTASIRYIRQRAPHAVVIFDGKRNDIGNTAEAYARECFDRYAADAATVNPYMGEDSLRPFLKRADRGVVLLCRTSNSGGKDFQDLVVDGAPLYMQVAGRAARDWNGNGNVMLVVGATNPSEMAALRRAASSLKFPGTRYRRARRGFGFHLRRRPQRGRCGPADQRVAQHQLCRWRQRLRHSRRGARAVRGD